MLLQNQNSQLLLDGLSDEYDIIPLKGGLTNKVYQLTHKDTGDKHVLKIGSSLNKEIFFAGNMPHITYHPKILATGILNDGMQYIVMDYKDGYNGKEIVPLLQSNDWMNIGKQMGTILKQIHTTPISTFQKNKQQIIDEIMAFFHVENCQVVDNIIYNEQLTIVQEKLSSEDFQISIIHGDYSPHNMLFGKNMEEEYYITASLDPGARLYYGPKEIDIVYLLNTRWVRDYSTFENGFIEGYGPWEKDSLYQILDRMMIMYLIETYYALHDIQAVEKLKQKLV